jgi:hypothetical protein
MWKIIGVIMTKLIKTVPLALLSIILLTASTTHMVITIVFAESDNSVNAAGPQVHISYDNSHMNDSKRGGEVEPKAVKDAVDNETDWDDIEYLRDAKNNTIVDYKNLLGLNLGKVYNPNFIDNADWFLNNSNYEDYGDYYLVPYRYNWYYYTDISGPWYGCEAQSKAMLVTAKEYKETGNSRYLDFSKKVFNGLNSPVLNQDGWLLGVGIDNKNAKILNSQLFCVANLMTYYEYTGDKQAITLFDKGVDVIEKNINSLTTDCGTYYTLSKDNPVSHQKHPEYIKMLERLYLMTGSNTLKNTLDKWQHDYEFPCYSK